MKSNYLELDNAQRLIDLLRTLYTPDKTLMAGCALLHVLYEQTTTDQATLSAYNLGEVWCRRYVKATGVLDTTLLIDASDFIARVSQAKIWSQNVLRMIPTNDDRLELLAITGVTTNNKPQVAAKITINCYKGDLADFNYPELQWQLVATLTGLAAYDFSFAGKSLASFSQLRNDNSCRPARLEFKDDLTNIYVTERKGTMGIAIAGHTINCELTNPETFAFNINGRYLDGLGSVFNEHSQIEISLSPDITNPTHVKFAGDAGEIILPLVDDYSALALAQYASPLFQGIGLTLVASRLFDAQELLLAVQIHVSKQGDAQNSVVLNVTDTQAELYKINDFTKTEQSFVPVANPLATHNPFPTILVEQTYFCDAIEHCCRHVLRQQRLQKQQQQYEFFEEITAAEVAGVLLELQLYTITRKNKIMHILRITTNETDAACNVISSTQLAEDVLST